MQGEGCSELTSDEYSGLIKNSNLKAPICWYNIVRQIIFFIDGDFMLSYESSSIKKIKLIIRCLNGLPWH